MLKTNAPAAPATIQPATPDRLIAVLKTVVAIVAIAYIVTLLVIVFLRLFFPYELELMEGGSLIQIQRLVDGQKLYVSPTLDFVPFIYSPLYFYVSAAFAKIIGVSFVPLRLLSILATIACGLVIGRFVQREMNSKFAALLAVGVYTASFKVGGAWFDISRSDMLALLFLLTAIYLVRFGQGWQSGLLVGVLVWLTFLTKQNLPIVIAPVLLYSLFQNWRRTLVMAATAGTLVLGSIFALDKIYDGWFSYYVFKLPGQHNTVGSSYASFWLQDMLLVVPVALGLAYLYISRQLTKRTRHVALFYLAMAVGSLGLGWVARLNNGGYNNSLIPAYAVLAILMGLGTHELLTAFRLKEARQTKWLQSAVLVAALVQFVLLFYNPVEQVPTSQDVAAGDRLVAKIRQMPGEVFVPNHCYLAIRAGKATTCMHAIATHELMGGFGGDVTPEGAKLNAEIQARLDNKYYQVIVTDTEVFGWLADGIEKNYYYQAPLFTDAGVFLPVTGRHIRPESTFIPRQ